MVDLLYTSEGYHLRDLVRYKNKSTFVYRRRQVQFLQGLRYFVLSSSEPQGGC
jgi:hypothetical protein